MHDEYLKSLVSQVKDAKETKGKNDLERIIAEQELKIKNLEAISKVHQEQNGKLQLDVNKKDEKIGELEGELYQLKKEIDGMPT